MIKKRLNTTDIFTHQLEENKAKINKIQIELAQSQLNKKYRDLGEYAFNSLQRKKKIDLQSVKWKRLISEIKELIGKINKYRKVGK